MMSSGWENSDCSDCEEYYECEDSLNEDDWDSDWPFSNIGESTETLVPKGQIYTEMSELLGRVAEETNYSFGDKATVLSGLPGLGVKGCGILALPMRKENAAEIEKQGKVVREKVWMVTGDQVEVKNPEWVEGLEKLGKMSAEKLGFKNVALRPVLDKLLLYEEGGQFEKQKDGGGTQCVARLLVQLPSVYTGGDLLVYEEETQKQARYKFGKDDGAAQFDPYFVVYTAGAHRVVEKVTSGCCLMLLYSLCLPRGIPSFNGKSLVQVQRMQLAEIIKKLAKGQRQDDVEVKSESGTPNCVDNANILNTSAIFAFMLSRSCQKNSIEAKGIGALSGVDFNRCQLLEAANALVHPKHQLKLYIARLHFNHNGRWGASQAQESASLYSLSGQSLGAGVANAIEWTKKFNFLNPGKKTLSQLWKQHDYESYEHERFAIVGWPPSSDIKSTFDLLGDVITTEVVLADNPINFLKIQQLLGYMAEQQRRKPYGYSYSLYENYTSMPLQLCQKFCQAVADTGDVTLADLFLKTCFARMKEKREMIPAVAVLVRKVSWSVVKDSLMKSIDHHQISFAVRLELILALTDALGDDPDARTALTKIAMEKVHCLLIMNSDAFISPSSLTLLWKHAVARENKNIFIDARDVFMKKDGKFLGSVVKALSGFVHAESQPVHQFALISLASRRRSWLLAEIKNISKPFTYEIPPSDIPGAAELVSFFCGTDPSYIIRGFTSITQARSRVGLLSRRLKTSGLVMTAEGRGRNSFVRMIKRGTMFDPRKQKILEYKSEIARLDQLILLSRSNISGHKHPRDDASTVVTIE